jgi:hypothetical protein
MREPGNQSLTTNQVIRYSRFGLVRDESFGYIDHAQKTLKRQGADVNFELLNFISANKSSSALGNPCERSK